MFEFVGRVDQQVKIRGFRVELGEIETRLRGLEGISDAVVVLRKDSGDHPYLAAFCIWKGPTKEIPEIQKQLRLTLPDYMVPASFETLRAYPMTDRKSTRLNS